MNRHPAIVQLWHPQALSWSPPWIVRKCVKYALIAYMQSWLPTRCRTQHFKITVGIESVKIAEIIPILVFLIFPRPQLKDCPRLILSKVFCARFLQFMFRVDFGCSSPICVFFSPTQTFPFFGICLFQEYLCLFSLLTFACFRTTSRRCWTSGNLSMMKFGQKSSSWREIGENDDEDGQDAYYGDHCDVNDATLRF